MQHARARAARTLATNSYGSGRDPVPGDRPLQLADVDLLHAEHGFHRALRLRRFMILQHLRQHGGNDLPCEAVLSRSPCVDGPIEVLEQLQWTWIQAWKHLAHEDGSHLLLTIDPEEGVEDAGKVEATGDDGHGTLGYPSRNAWFGSTAVARRAGT